MIKFIPFDKLISKVVDNRGKTCPTADFGVPLIATNCIRNDHLYPVFENIRYVDNYTYSSWFRGHPEPEDIILVLKGSPGRVAFVPNPVNFCIAQDMVAIRPNHSLVYPKYLFAVLRSKQIQDEIFSLHVGTLIPHFRKSDFKDLLIPIKDKESQKFIGDIYYNLSTKIDLLHRQNKTLEAMAETLFRQWFVKAPEKDWKEESLSKIANFQNGLAWQKFPPHNNYEKLPVLKIKELSEGISENSDFATDDVDDKFVVDAGDIIFSWSASLMVKIWDEEKCVLNQHLFKVTSELFPKWFIYLWTKQHLGEFIAISKSHATTMGHIKRKDLDNALVVIPKNNELQKMTTIISPLIEKIISNNTQITTLNNLREMLLPKLISGEVTVKY